MDVIAYIAGFVIFRCKKAFSSFPVCSLVIQKLIDEDASTKLISVKSRGGLTQPTSNIIPFFILAELTFRKSCSAGPLATLQSFQDSICSDPSISDIFYDCTYGVESDAQSQEKVLLYLLSIFFHVRCNAKCRQTLERYLMKTKTSKKQMSLRKDISQ